MDDNHHKDENLNFYEIHKPEEVEKLMDAYDETYDNFFRRKDSLLLNINKLSQLHHGEDEHSHAQMIAGAHGAILRSSTKLVEKRNNYLQENIAHLDEDQ
jgi:flavorubredoxin